MSLVWYEHEFSKAWSIHPRVTCPFVIDRQNKSKPLNQISDLIWVWTYQTLWEHFIKFIITLTNSDYIYKLSQYHLKIRWWQRIIVKIGFNFMLKFYLTWSKFHLVTNKTEKHFMNISLSAKIWMTLCLFAIELNLFVSFKGTLNSWMHFKCKFDWRNSWHTFPTIFAVKIQVEFFKSQYNCCNLFMLYQHHICEISIHLKENHSKNMNYLFIGHV